MKRFYRSKIDRRISGICGGIGAYFNVDSNLIRLGFILLAIMTGGAPAILGYIIAAIIIPEEGESD
ncbi:MAG: PspC domain-containing protein [Candidatus Magasanikbacteria bacterium]|nr:PspC domain-containing protein [Candidatus Magasanikbacteria bacterium]